MIDSNEYTFLMLIIMVSISIIAFTLLWVIGKKIIKSDPMLQLAKHTHNYKAVTLTKEEQLEWRLKTKEWIGNNFGKWPKQSANIHIESGVITVSFPYYPYNVKRKFDTAPLPDIMKKIYWRVCLGVYVYNPELIRNFPPLRISTRRKYESPDHFPAETATNILIIRDLCIKDHNKTYKYFELLKSKMKEYL